jgi:hypothetical protein
LVGAWANAAAAACPSRRASRVYHELVNKFFRVPFTAIAILGLTASAFAQARGVEDGGTLTTANQRRIARQSNGRFYQERWVLVPKNGPVESTMSHLQFADPNNHTLTTYFIWSKVCKITAYEGSTSTLATVLRPDREEPGSIPDGRGTVTKESLGKDVAEHVETIGTRITRRLNSWTMGNSQPIIVTREFWFAPSLGMNLISKVSDSRFGSQTFIVSDLALGEPDAQLFDPPKGFTIKDDRTPVPQQ